MTLLASLCLLWAMVVPAVLAKVCVTLSVPVSISARTGVFNIAPPQTNLDATTFAQNLTQQGRNFTETALSGYKTTSGNYQISAQFCKPSVVNNVSNQVLQILTHGIGFDKTYWDNPYNGFNYSYVDVAVDQHNYCTFAYDRLGIGSSSHGDPLNEIQAPLEVAALASVTTMLRNGNLPGVSTHFSKVTHVGHSFGSAQTYLLVNQYPKISDGIVLTGFSLNGNYLGYFGAGADFQQANLNQPFRFGAGSLDSLNQLLNPVTGSTAGLAVIPSLGYVNGYIANSNVNSQQYLFFLPNFFDAGLLQYAENTKQPATVGELLTLASLAPVNTYSGPVLVITGSGDLPYCGGNCFATGDPTLPSIPAAMAKNFPNAGSNFQAYIQPNTGHGLNFHYNSTGAYQVINQYLKGKGLAPS